MTDATRRAVKSAVTDRPVVAFAVVSYDWKGAAEASGFSVTTLQEAAAEGSLTVHYGGRSRTKPVIRAVDLDEWVQSLPTERRAS